MTLREAQRRWREGEPGGAALYLAALEEHGLLPEQHPRDIPMDADPIEVTWVGKDHAAFGVPGHHDVLVSGGVPVAALTEDGPVWSPAAAMTGAQRSHVRAWWVKVGRDPAAVAEVAPEVLVDLLRLVPVQANWPTCDRCLEPRRKVERGESGLTFCEVCR